MGYKEDRSKAYPSAEEQLSMIWKDLKKSGNLRDGEWFKAIANIKATHEKPIVEKE